MARVLQEFGFLMEESKDEIIAFLKPAIDGINLMGNGLLIATYFQPPVTAGGIRLPDSMTNENRYQGKAGLVLAMGYDAFRWFEGDNEYQGPKPSVGEWVFYRASDSWEVGLVPDPKKSNFISVKWVLDKDIKGVIARPDLVY